MIHFKKLTSAWFARECGSNTFGRGSRYFREQRARLETVHRVSPTRISLRGECRGSKNHPYQLRVTIEEGRNDVDLSGFCSCPMGYNCKHVVALVLTWQAQNTSEVSDPAAIETWLAELQVDPESERRSREEALLYLLLPGTGNPDALRVELLIARRRRDGSWGKGRSCRLSAMSYTWQRPNWMQPIDEQIRDFLRLCDAESWGDDCVLTGAGGHFALLKMIDSGRLFLGEARDGPVQRGASRQLIAHWRRAGKTWQVQLEVAPAGRMLAVNPPCYLDAEQLQAGPLQLPDGLDGERLEWLQRAPPIDAGQAAAISRRMALAAPGIPTPKPVRFETVQGPPVACLTVDFDPDRAEQARASLRFDYHGLAVAAGRPETSVTGSVGDRLLQVTRDFDAERTALAQLEHSGLVATEDDPAAWTIAPPLDATKSDAPRDRWLDWWQHQVPGLEADGWRIERAGGAGFRLSRAESIDGEIDTQGSDWFGLRFDL
ncbi:MAG: SWIM zinc finger family protein, partial [Wenzhouxiangellaceae bacterium]|nr:SWIM zinc finger family protein [Wenzhouxiangellaceae bacterium]